MNNSMANCGLEMADDFTNGWLALKAGNYKTALHIWQPLAAQGDADAQNVVGGMYANGQGVSMDMEEAAKWYRRAAGQGHAEAQFTFGLMNANGEGMPRNYVSAYLWWNFAAKQGHESAEKGKTSLESWMLGGDIFMGMMEIAEYHNDHADDRLKVYGEGYFDDCEKDAKEYGHADEYYDDYMDDYVDEDDGYDVFDPECFDLEYMDNWH